MRDVFHPEATPYGALLGVGRLLVGGLSCMAVWLVVATATLMPGTVAMSLQGSTAMPSGPGGWRVWAVVLLQCVVGFYASFPLARLVGRIFPPKVGGTPRWGLVLAGLGIAVGFFLSLGTPSVLRELFVMAAPMLVMAGCVLTWTIVWQTRTGTRALSPYILFLRRFSSFADRSVLSALLSSLPPGLRTVFLAPHSEAIANFSPVVIAFSGIRLRRPFRSCPISLSARDVEWEDEIEDLVRASSCVVVDASEDSPAMRREVALVRRLLPADRVLWLSDLAATHPVAQTGASDRVVHYRRSWRAAMPRIAVESALSLLAALMVGAILGANPALPRWGPWLAAAIPSGTSTPPPRRVEVPDAQRAARLRRAEFD